MATPNPWEEGYKVFKDEYTKEQIDKMKLVKIIQLLSEKTGNSKGFYWDMIYKMVTS